MNPKEFFRFILSKSILLHIIILIFDSIIIRIIRRRRKIRIQIKQSVIGPMYSEMYRHSPYVFLDLPAVLTRSKNLSYTDVSAKKFRAA